MKVLAIIQTRMGSSRLPGKSLMKINGKTLLQHTIERSQKAKNVDKVIVATSTDASNDPIADLCKKINVECFRGSENDVLSRFVEAAKPFNPELIVRICGDEPLLDPKILEKAIEMHDCEYSTTIGTVPNGLDVEIINFEVLKKLDSLTLDDFYREHVTKYILDNPNDFKIKKLDFGKEIARPEIKLTVDTKDDFDFVNEIYSKMDNNNVAESIIELVDKGAVKRKPIILLRADGSHEKGMGDIVTLMNIAENLPDFEFRFACKENKEANDFVLKKGFELLILKDNELQQIKDYCENNNIKKCIVELVPNDPEYVAKLSEFLRIMMVTFVDDIEVNSDIILSWDVSSEDFNFKGDAKQLLGPKYVPIKPVLKKYRKKKQNEKIKTITVSFGGSDPQNITEKVVKLLKDEGFEINVIVGPAFKDKSFENANVIRNPSNIYQIFSESDLVISAGGFTSFELCALNVPFIGISAIPIEKRRLTYMDSKGACKFISPSEIDKLLKTINLLDKKKREEMSEHQSKLLDGDGGKRIANAIREAWK